MATTITEESTIIDAAARAAHEVNKVWCELHGDRSQQHWEDAPEWQRESCRLGVRGVLKGNTPEQSHESWLAHKDAEGWVYGETKDPAAKTHPCMLPYAQLPQEQQAKDKIFVTVVRTVLAAVGISPV